MPKRSATTGLMVDAAHVLHKTMEVLSEPDQGAAILVSRTATRRVLSWRMREEILRSELVIDPSGLVTNTKSLLMYGGQW